MKRSTDNKAWLLPGIIATAVICAAPASAQDASVGAPPQSAQVVPSGSSDEEPKADSTAAIGAFGLNSQDYWLASTAFAARTGTNQWSYQSFLYFATATDGQYEAQIELPAGALMTSFRCYFYDTDAVANGTAAIWRQGYTFSTNVPTNTSVTAVTSAGAAGYQQVVSSLNETIKYRDGDLRNVYTVLVSMPNSIDVRFRGCRIFWNRTVSPAPLVATFGDVPTTSPIFRFVEALVASGVTAGCAGGNYCPDQPLTRGQMAVFLSAALGLHWPW